MRVDFVTLFPDMVRGACEFGVIGRAVREKMVQIEFWNPRDFATDRYRTVDDRPYGGGPGMLLKVEPLRTTIRSVRQRSVVGAPVLLMSPQGTRLDQSAVRRLANLPGLVLVSGRYEGIDERLIESEIDEEWSIGDYVVSGGELPALVLFDAVVRLLPGVLGDDASAQQDSYMEGLLDCPHFTRPDEVDGRKVPDILHSGDHERIRRWRLKQALGRTWQRRPDLLAKKELDSEQQKLLEEFQKEHR
jgi:tRNA (guanine37-N1)-methyltransferase